MLPHILSFKGRIKRVPYAATFIPLMALSSYLRDVNVDYELHINVVVAWVVLAQGAKRCHDLGVSGWLQAIPFFVFGLMFVKGNDIPNRFGPPPP